MLLVLPAFAGSAEAERPKLVVGGDHNFPPYEFLENGKPTGFNIELIRAVAEVMGVDIELRLGPWSKARRDLEQRKIDIITGMVYSDERSKLFDFSVPHTMISPGLFVRSDSPIRALADIRGKEIIVQEGDIMHDFLRKEALTSRIITVADPPEALRLLASGKYDGAFLSSEVHKYYIASKFAFSNLRAVRTDLPPQRYCFAVAKGNRALLYRLDQGLVILKSTGKYQEIYEKWFGVYEKRSWWEIIKYFVLALAIIAALFIASLFWSRSLQRQVGIRTAELHTSEEDLRKAHAELEQHVEDRTIDLAQTNARLKAEIAEHKKTEEALRESEEKHRAVVDAFDGQIYICSPEYRIEFMNKRLIERTGRDATGELCYVVLHNRDSVCPWCVNERVQRGETVRWEVQSPKDKRWYYVVNTPIYHADGTISKQAMILDITDRKLMEEALRVSEEKYRSLVDNVNIGVYRSTVGNLGRLLEANPALSKLTGYTHEELMQLSVADVYQDTHAKKLLLEDLKTNGFVKNREIVMKKKDGTPVWASLTITVQRDEQGGIKWIDGVGEDITERKRGEELLAQKTAELERSNKELEHFALVASHDLKSPLSTIGGFAQLLQEQYEDKLDEKARQALAHIIKGTHGMGLLINDLLAYARVASGGQTFAPVHCNRVISTALANLQADIKEHAAVITCDDMPIVHGDEMQFVQLFQNLIGNALKYRDERPPQIHISATRISDCGIDSRPAPTKTGNADPKSAMKPGWLFSVEDNGIGIDPVHLDQVFVLFKRLHHGDKYSGTGIGLAICKRIVERHNGRIWVESEPGKGSMFYFTIPDRLA